MYAIIFLQPLFNAVHTQLHYSAYVEITRTASVTAAFTVLMLQLLLFLLTLARLKSIETEGIPDVPSFQIIVTKSGIKRLEDEIFDKITVLEKKYTGVNSVIIPDVTSDQYKISNLHMSQLQLDRPEVQIVPDRGLRVRQGVRCVVEGDYKIKALFFWVDGKITITTRFTLDLTAGVEDHTRNGKLAITSDTCQVTFHTFDADLHNLVFSAVAKLMRGTITDSVEGALCEQARQSFSEISIFERIPFEDRAEKDEIYPQVIFKPDRIEIYARLPKDKNSHPSPELTNTDNRMICFIVSKKLVENYSRKRKLDKIDVLRDVQKFLPVLNVNDADFKEMKDFFRMCSDLDVNKGLGPVF